MSTAEAIYAVVPLLETNSEDGAFTPAEVVAASPEGGNCPNACQQPMLRERARQPSARIKQSNGAATCQRPLEH